MLRRFKIYTRLLMFYFIFALISVTGWLIGIMNLNAVKNSEQVTFSNLNTLEGIYNEISTSRNNLDSIFRHNEATHVQETLQSVKAIYNNYSEKQDSILDIQDEYHNYMSLGEIQVLYNAFEISRYVYFPAVNEIITLLERGEIEEARRIHNQKISPLHLAFYYYFSDPYYKLTSSSEQLARKNQTNAIRYSMRMLYLTSILLAISFLIAHFISKSISDPLKELESAAENVLQGKLFDVNLDPSNYNDEIASHSRKLLQMVDQLALTRQLELEAVESQHEKDRALEASRAKSYFLAKMSHEIRTPMNAITGMAELSLRESLPQAAREHVLAIKYAGANLLSIINDILDFSKIETGKLEIIPRDYLFSSLVNDVISIVRMRVHETGLWFTVNIDCNIPDQLCGDDARIRQVMLNLLTNAVKYTKKGHVALEVRGEASDDGYLRLTIEIADSGIGISQENLEKIFENFVQVDVEKNIGVEGTGLGLSITHSLVKAMGGNIEVKSEYGSGSVFTVVLPQKIRDPRPLATVNSLDGKRVLVYEQREIYASSILRTIDNLGIVSRRVLGPAELEEQMAGGGYQFAFIASALHKEVREICSKFGSGVKTVLLADIGEAVADRDAGILAMPAYSTSIANILNGVSDGYQNSDGGLSSASFTAPGVKALVVDDVKTNLNVAKGLLALYKIQTKLCVSGASALEAIKFEKYDLVFMDHMMPEMDGVEATAQIRALGKNDPYYKDVPIIALTANAVLGMKEMFLSNGFNDFLPKPIEMSALNSILGKWVPQDRQLSKQVRRILVKFPTRATSESFGIEGLDTARGVAISGGTREKYFRTLAMFLQDGQDKAVEIKKALEAGNLPLYTTHIHALKSAAANIGATELSGKAKMLEEASRRGDTTYIHANTGQVLSDLGAVMEKIGTAILEGAASNYRRDGQDGVKDKALLKKELENLKIAIEDVDPAKINAATKRVRSLAKAAGSDAELEIILRRTLLGEYEEAVQAINGYSSSTIKS
ncbi:MAG: ATP-binding protein [Holophagaceae bacterium]|nr:ATP-binding protein [Holophagaceae bacterium]